jgi:hypothetical protein
VVGGSGYSVGVGWGGIVVDGSVVGWCVLDLLLLYYLI